MSVQRNFEQALEADRQPNNGRNDPDEQKIALVVDDEPLVRHLICSVLGNLGWRTLEAEDGAQALLLEADEDIDLLITDYEIPRLKGIAVADALRGRLPDLRVVVVSGLASVGQMASGRGYRFLAKPFDTGQLASLITSLAVAPAPEVKGARPSEAPSAVQTLHAQTQPARSPAPRGRFSGWESSPRARDEMERPIGAGKCTLRCFPSDDAQFRADAQRILAASIEGKARTWGDVLGQARDRITELYPGASIHPRNLLAANGDPNEYWYCYRDGGLTPPAPDG